jgi:hypothetical protein
VTRRIGRIELDPKPLPPIYTHAAWCRWLSSRGCLSPRHRGCLDKDYCIAEWAAPSGQPWRTPERSLDVI